MNFFYGMNLNWLYIVARLDVTFKNMIFMFENIVVRSESNN